MPKYINRKYSRRSLYSLPYPGFIRAGVPFLIFLFLWASPAQSQVVLNLQLPPLGLTIKPQLWNLSLINTGSENLQVRVELTFTDVSTNQRVLTGTSNLLVLPKGVKQVQHRDVLPVTYNYGNPGYSVDPNPDGFLPVGIFNVCYSVIRVNTDAPERISEECITLEVEPLSPPQLVIPADDESVDLTRPFFAWTPPAPFNSYSSLLYDWILVEVQPTQSPADAIQQNIPVLTRQNVTFTSLQYPLSAPELDSSKLYAWRVTAKNNTSAIANSETWRFRVKKYEADTLRGDTAATWFARLHREEDAAWVPCNGILRFEYRNEVNTAAADIILFDISSASRRRIPLDSTAHAVQFGQNFMQIDLRNTGGMINGHMYLLQLTGARNEKWYLRFEYRK